VKWYAKGSNEFLAKNLGHAAVNFSAGRGQMRLVRRDKFSWRRCQQLPEAAILTVRQHSTTVGVCILIINVAINP